MTVSVRLKEGMSVYAIEAVATVMARKAVGVRRGCSTVVALSRLVCVRSVYSRRGTLVLLRRADAFYLYWRTGRKQLVSGCTPRNESPADRGCASGRNRPPSLPKFRASKSAHAALVSPYPAASRVVTGARWHTIHPHNSAYARRSRASCSS